MHTYAVVESIYITTRFGGVNHHHQGRQHHRPKQTAVSGCLSCNGTHRYISRSATKRSRLCHTVYVESVTFNIELSLSHMGKYDINSSVLKREAKYSNVCLTRWTQTNSSVFWSVMLSSLTMMVGATETCRNMA